MTPYLIMIAVPALLALASFRSSNLMLFMVALFFWLMIGFRFEVGMDWSNYLRLYNAEYKLGANVSASTALFQLEPGFALLSWFAAKTGGGIIMINAVSALIFCWGFFIFAKNCREPWLAVVIATPLLVVAFAMSGIRQAIAMGVVFYVFSYWDQRSVVARIALVLLASLFHFSAVFILIFVALSARIQPVAKLAAVAAVGLLILLAIYVAPTAMQSYSELYVSGRRRLEAPGALAQIAVIAAAAVAYFVYRKKWVEANGDHLLLRNLAIVALLSVPAAFISSVGAYRFALYLWPMAMYVYSGIPAMIDKAEGQFLYRLMLVLASAALMLGWLTYANNSSAWLPYQNWLLLEQRS